MTTTYDRYKQYHNLKRGDALVVRTHPFISNLEIGQIVIINKIRVWNDGSVTVTIGTEAHDARHFGTVINNSLTCVKRRGRPYKPKITKEIDI